MKNKKTISVTAHYDASFYPKGDSVAKKIVGKQIVGSGMGFGLRDIRFTFKEMSKAITAFRKLSKLDYPFACITLTQDND